MEEYIEKIKKKRFELVSKYAEIERRLKILESEINSLKLSLDVMSTRLDQIEKKVENLKLSGLIPQLMEIISIIDSKIEEWKGTVKSISTKK